MKRFSPIALLSAIALLLAASCSKNAPDPTRGTFSDNNNDGNDTSTTTVYDFTPELSDSETRYIDDDLQLRYSNGGILVIRDNTTATISLIDLASGHHVDLTSSSPLVVGSIQASLSIDGVTVDTEKISVENATGDAIWISILTSAATHPVLVLNRTN